MNFMISRDLLVTAIQLLQQAQHPTVPHQTVSAVIENLRNLPVLQQNTDTTAQDDDAELDEES